MEIGAGYQERIRFLEEKLQNMRPSVEQSMVLDQVVEQVSFNKIYTTYVHLYRYFCFIL